MTDEAKAACLRAMGYLELQMPQDALAELDDLSGTAAEAAPVRHLRVDSLFRLQEWHAAAEICLPMLEREPADPAWWIQAAYAQRRARSVAEAEPILLAALRHHPQHSLILYNLACYACVQQRHDEACSWISRSIAAGGEVVEMALRDPDLAPIVPWIVERQNA